MGNFYFDTSALAKRYVVEVGQAWTRRLTRPRANNGIFTSQLTTVELEVALTRKALETALSVKERDGMISLFRGHVRHQYTMQPISDDVLQRARALVRRPGLPHPLRTYDALHLATALTLADMLAAAKAAPATFVTADRRLLAIARHLGMNADNPEDHP